MAVTLGLLGVSVVAQVTLSALSHWTLRELDGVGYLPYVELAVLLGALVWTAATRTFHWTALRQVAVLSLIVAGGGLGAALFRRDIVPDVPALRWLGLLAIAMLAFTALNRITATQRSRETAP